MGTKNSIIYSIFVIVLIYTLSGCSNTDRLNREQPFERNDFIMGTIVSQRIYGKNAEKAAVKVVERLKEIEESMTVNAPGGEINKLNENSGKSKVILSSDSYHVLKTGVKYSVLTDGAFDVTIGPLVKLWGIYSEHPRIPAQAEIERVKELVDYRDIIFNEANRGVMLKKAGQMADLGGIAKGFGGDEAIRIYRDWGIKSAYVNLGGNIVALGNKPDGSKWRVGIQDPRGLQGAYIAIIPVADKTVVTSGDYERYFEEGGVRYHHILDPRSGYPARTKLISSTIIADKSIDADALSTSVFVMGLDKGMEFVEGIKGVEALFVDENRKIYVTDGLRKKVVFKGDESGYEYIEKR